MTRKFSEEACQKKWEEFLADLENNPDQARTWRTIKSLPGTPSSTSLDKGRPFTTNPVKENALMKDYAAVNHVRFNKEDRSRIR